MIINRFISTAHIDIKHSARRYWRQLSIVLLICTLLLSWALTGFAPFGHKVTVAQAGGSLTGSSFVISQTLAGPRNNYSGQVGMEFTTGTYPLTVIALGRIYIGGNTGTHTVYLYDSTKTLITSVSVNTATGARDSLGYIYTPLPSAITLTASTSYYLMTSETSGGDQFYDDVSTTVTLGAGATVNTSMYGTSGPTTAHTAGHTYGTVNLLTISPTLTQRHYIFQQDNGTSVNSNSNNGTADTALTNVKKGERLSARIQVDNTDPANGYTGQFGLFYDHNDGIWTKVGQPGATAISTGGGNCSDTNWNCTNVDTNTNVGTDSSLAISPSGQAWVSYYDTTNLDLKVAQYVGSGGNCSATAWSCTSVDTTGSVGQYTSIGFSPSGNPWVSYFDSTNGDLKVAQYVGSSGTGCASTAWTCTTVDSTGTVGKYTSISFGATGNAWVSYYDATNLDLKVAQYVGSSGTGCASTAWTCTSIDTTGDVGQQTAITIDTSGNAWIGYYDNTNGDLKVANYVGSAGSGCASTAWTCTTVDSTGTVGQNPAIAIDPNGKAWVSYSDVTNKAVKVAQYVGSSGTGCASTAWTCTSVDGTTNAGAQDNTIAFNAIGIPWISYYSTTQAGIVTAKYVGASGTGCSSSAWTCTKTVATGTASSYQIALAFDGSGNAWLNYYDPSVAKMTVASLVRGGEIQAGYGLSGSSWDALTSAAAGTCTSGTTFSNGMWLSGSSVSSQITIASSKCTEVAFMIDTSQATTGTTYRLALRDMAYQRGLNAYSVYPTLTIVSSANDKIRVSKDHIDRLGSPTSCTDTSWDCMTVNTYNAAANANDGRYNKMGFDGNGNPWIAAGDSSDNALVVNAYTPGAAASGTCSANWVCTKVHSDGGTTGFGTGPVLKFDPSGAAWVAEQDYTNKNLYVDKYVGSGGTGCGSGGSTAWTCTLVDKGAITGGDLDIAFDTFGNPWVAYQNYSALSQQVAYYSVGAPASGNCAANWVCTTVATGVYASRGKIAIDSNNNVTIEYNAYHSSVSSGIGIIKYVGSGGSCSNTAWDCTTLKSGLATTLPAQTYIVYDKNNVAWAAYHDTTASSFVVAEYVGSGGTGCDIASWNCVTVDNDVGGTTNTGDYPGLAVDPNGTLYASYTDATTTGVKVAIMNGNGSGNCTSTAWNCSVVDHTTASMGNWTNIQIDPSGDPWVTYQDVTNGDSKVAKLVIPLSYTQARYKLDNTGYLSVASTDSVFDSLPATSYTPIYRFDYVMNKNTNNFQPTWVGQSTVAASTDSIKLQVWRGGTTNAWTDLSTNTTCAAASTCTITPSVTSSNLSDYYDGSGSQYVLHFRLYQASGSSQTLKTDSFGVSFQPTLDQLLRHGTWFNNGIKQAMTF